jgi:beta-1,4-N-acetylglucosaminyltransferase
MPLEQVDDSSGARGRPVFFVASSGGHLQQLYRLRAAAGRADQVWVTFDRSDARSLLRDQRVLYAYHPTNRSLKNLLKNLTLAARLIAKERPSAVVTTGAGVGVPFCWIGRLFGARIVFVESLTRIHSSSLSGKLIRPVAHRYFVQWPELASRIRRARYCGTVLDLH